ARWDTVKKTVEGFSYYHEDSNLGTKCSALLPGTLISGERRKASARCEVDTECLVIAKRDFDKVMQESITHAQDERVAFLEEHVPGMREVVSTRGKQPHPSSFFRKAAFCKGHDFLKQGQVAEEAIYVVLN
ncbi:unnamed protein product, partial [Polarella glacialis]